MGGLLSPGGYSFGYKFLNSWPKLFFEVSELFDNLVMNSLGEVPTLLVHLIVIEKGHTFFCVFVLIRDYHELSLYLQ